MPDPECITGSAYIPAIAAHSDAASKETVWAPHICPLPSSTEPRWTTSSRRKPRPAGRPGRADGAAAGPRRHTGLRSGFLGVRRTARPCQAARFLCGHGQNPPLRRGGHRPAAAGPAGPVGSAHRPGSRPDRLRPGQPAAGLHLPHLPRARRRPDPQRGPCRAAAPVPRRLQRRLEPQGHQLPPLHPGPRRPDPACGRLRDGHPARPEVRGVRRTRGRSRPGRGAQGCRHGLLRRRRQLRRRRPRVHGVRLVLQGARGVLLPEQPLGDLRAQLRADPHPARQPRQGLRLPRHPGGRQRRDRRPRRHRVGAGTRPPGRGPRADRGLHLPRRRAHHGG